MPQYARAGPWCSAEVSRLPHTGGQAVAQALCAYLSLGVSCDKCVKGTLSLCQPIALREQVRSREAVLKARRIGDQMHG
jgi:hypothetical protein